jgi:hypothetical protein
MEEHYKVRKIKTKNEIVSIIYLMSGTNYYLGKFILALPFIRISNDLHVTLVMGTSAPSKHVNCL